MGKKFEKSEKTFQFKEDKVQTRASDDLKIRKRTVQKT